MIILTKTYALLLLALITASIPLTLVYNRLTLSATTEDTSTGPQAQKALINAVIEVTEFYNIYNNGLKPFNLSSLGEIYTTYPQEDPRQTLLDYKVYVSGKQVNYTLESKLGNLSLMAVLQVNDRVIEPGENISIRIHYKVKTNPPPTPVTKEDVLNAQWNNVSSIEYYNDLIKITGLWNYSNPLIKMLSDYLWSKSNGSLGLYLLEAIRWIRENTVYYSRVPARHPVEVVIERRGDCDDDANLLITLLRAKGIPAVLEAGLVYVKGYHRSTRIDDVIHYEIYNGGPHGWVKVYIPGMEWRPIDLTFILTESNNPLDALNEGAYMKMPVVIIQRGLGEDYASETVEETRRLEKLDAFLEIKITLDLVEG